jgi:hypothetical protein
MPKLLNTPLEISRHTTMRGRDITRQDMAAFFCVLQETLLIVIRMNGLLKCSIQALFHALLTRSHNADDLNISLAE